jgi:ABC-type oligopeptide transport system substrate-binding subunit
MKKLLTLGLSLLAVVAALSLSACGQQDSGGSGETTTSGQPNQGGTATPNTGGAGTTEGNSGATPAEPAAGGGQ